MIAASKITLGTMRLSDAKSVPSWVEFFSRAYDLGIRNIHVSHEYDSWPFFCDIAAALRIRNPDKTFRYIAKLAEPNFDHNDFSARRLERSIDIYRSALAIDCLGDAQWMWRATLGDDGTRQEEYRRHAALVGDTFSNLKGSGCVERFLCFPYSVNFAELILDEVFIDGIAVYRNSFEREYDDVLDRCAAHNKMAHVIRPFFGGTTLTTDGQGAADQLAYVIDHPVIETAILSTSRMEHLCNLLSK